MKWEASAFRREEQSLGILMNDLHLVTVPTSDPWGYDTYWTTGLCQKGKVRVAAPRLSDPRTAAELIAAQYLLVERNVCGHNKAGAGLRLHVSCTPIPLLAMGEAEKGFLSPYANFLRTRFLGAQIRVHTGPSLWAEEQCGEGDTIPESEYPRLTLIDINGIGSVELTAHAVQQYVSRFDRKPEKAWRELSRIGGDAQPAVRAHRSALSDIKHRRQARYAMDAKRNVMLVIAEPDRPGCPPRLVTVVRPDANVRLVPMPP